MKENTTFVELTSNYIQSLNLITVTALKQSFLDSLNNLVRYYQYEVSNDGYTKMSRVYSNCFIKMLENPSVNYYYFMYEYSRLEIESIYEEYKLK